MKNEHYSGEIISKFQAARHYRMVILQDNKEITLAVPELQKTGSDTTLLSTIEPGDFIIKKKGEYKYSVIKGNDTIVFYVDTVK
jgi:hypothetical protein